MTPVGAGMVPVGLGAGVAVISGTVGRGVAAVASGAVGVPVVTTPVGVIRATAGTTGWPVVALGEGVGVMAADGAVPLGVVATAAVPPSPATITLRTLPVHPHVLWTCTYSMWGPAAVMLVSQASAKPLGRNRSLPNNSTMSGRSTPRVAVRGSPP